MKYLVYFIVLAILGLGIYVNIKEYQQKKEQPNTASRGLVQDSNDSNTEVIEIDPFPTTGNLFDIAKWIWSSFSIFASVVGLFLVAFEPIARWTKSEKDNSLLRLIQSWLDKFLPNEKQGGGTFKAYDKKVDAPKLAYVHGDTSKAAAADANVKPRSYR